MPAPTDGTTISGLTDGVTAQATDKVAAARGAGNVWLTIAYIKTQVLSGLGLAWGAITGTPTTLAGYGIADAASDAELAAHEADATNVHGITNTAALVLTNDSRLSDSRAPTGTAGGVLSGTYPNPGFAADMATQAELDSEASTRSAADLLLAPLASPAFTGTPTVPTVADATSNTQIATTAFVHALITALINASPATLDTLKELADAIGDDPNFATTVASSIATKLAKASNLSDLTNAATALTNLGLSANGASLVTAANYAAMKTLLALTIGTNVQAWNTQLDAIAALTTTSFGRSYLALADAAAARALAASAPLSATYITQTANSELSAEQALSALATGYVKNTTGTGVLSSQATPIPSADLGSGSPSATTFLRGDQTWATPSGGGGTIDGSGSAGQVSTWVDADTLTGSAGLLYDDTNKRLSIVNSGGTAELRITGDAGSQSLLTFYAGGFEKWEFFRQSTTHGFGIYDATNGQISMQIDPVAKTMSLHGVAGVGIVLGLTESGAVQRRATLNTTTSAAMYEHNTIASTGTPGDGFGAAWEYNMQDDTSTNVPAMEFNLRWATAAHGTRKARAQWYVLDTDYREALRLEASGSAPMIGFLGASAAVRQTGGSATAAGTYGATEQGMLQKVYDMARTFGLLT